jgi:hypothetical protein
MGGGRRLLVSLDVPWTPAYAEVTDRVGEGGAFRDKLARRRQGANPISHKTHGFNRLRHLSVGPWVLT